MIMVMPEVSAAERVVSAGEIGVATTRIAETAKVIELIPTHGRTWGGKALNKIIKNIGRRV